MKSTMKHTIVILNALGVVAVILAVLSLVTFFYIGNELEGGYYLGTYFTSLVVIILSFGFAKIIELLYEVRERLDTLISGKN
jgi:heme/copper-type cytochrome/quinol oxidase subunit 4